MIRTKLKSRSQVKKRSYLVLRVDSHYEADRFVWRWRSREREAAFETLDGVELSRKRIEGGEEWCFDKAARLR